MVNNIGDLGAKMISEGLKSNSTLTVLDLSGDEKEEVKEMNRGYRRKGNNDRNKIQR